MQGENKTQDQEGGWNYRNKLFHTGKRLTVKKLKTARKVTKQTHGNNGTDKSWKEKLGISFARKKRR